MSIPRVKAIGTSNIDGNLIRPIGLLVGNEVMSDVIRAVGAIFGAYVAYVCLCITRVFVSSYA